MRRILTVHVLLFLTAAGVAAERQPNVLVLVADDLRPDTIAALCGEFTAWLGEHGDSVAGNVKAQ